MKAPVTAAPVEVTTLLVDRHDIRRMEVATLPLTALAPHCVRLEVQRFALTANNVTYAASGDVLRYWQFYPSGLADKGIVPVWGFARVVASHCDGVEAGQTFYGFWPMARVVDVQPIRVSRHGFVNGAAHRAELPEIYNAYQSVDGPFAALAGDMLDRYALLQPLVATSILLDDFLAEKRWFGARELVLTSASGKTAVALAMLTAQRADRPAVVGLTSAANRAFVESLVCHDRVVTYDDIAAQVGSVDAMLVDFAGNLAVRQTIHQRFVDTGAQLTHSCAVGTSHWDRFDPSATLPPPRPVFFFAPAQARKRREAWGGARLAQVLFDKWLALAQDSPRWLDVIDVDATDAMVTTWQRVANGAASPRDGYVLRFA